MREWMWQMNENGQLEGELVVISIPYVDGEHFASNVGDFIPIVEFLQRLHDNGFVHGDIRCFNIIFGKCLIDFDYGGVEGSVRYPKGYVKELRDGYRIGEEEEVITTWHDWYALLQVILEFHRLQPSQISESNPGRLLQLYKEREALSQCLTGVLEPTRYEQKKIVEDVVRFLKDAQESHWTVARSTLFEGSLKDYGFNTGGGGGRRNASEPATDSPPEKPSLFTLGKTKK
jgi:hypothetical protein